jgi:hypothetical protein
LQRELNRLRQTVTSASIPPGVYNHFNQLYAQAQQIISLLTSMARRIDDREARSYIHLLIEAVGESVSFPF